MPDKSAQRKWTFPFSEDEGKGGWGNSSECHRQSALWQIISYVFKNLFNKFRKTPGIKIRKHRESIGCGADKGEGTIGE